MADPYTTFTNVRVTGDLDVTGTVGTNIAATEITVDADAPSGIDAGTLQAVLEALADRVQALEDAP